METDDQDETTSSLDETKDEIMSVNSSSCSYNYSNSDNEDNTGMERKKCVQELYPNKHLKGVIPPKVTVKRIIEGVNVSFPMEPYGCQVALMSKIIVGIKKSQNCLLESPTGSGKTLALLCGALAWQQAEKDRVNKLLHPDSPVDATQENTDMGKVQSDSSQSHADENGQSPYKKKKLSDEDDPMGQVKIHKRSNDLSFENLEEYHFPKIYYGTRTHTQLKQVIEEFKRTPYCGRDLARMAILSSRKKTCLQEYAKHQWSSYEEMCRKYTKVRKDSFFETHCSFFDNRDQLVKHISSNYGAFDIEDLKVEGQHLGSCPYYAARGLSEGADIIFCPYNYLIQPSTRQRLNINLENNVVIIDEAHNIENECRAVQTFIINWDILTKAQKELRKANIGNASIDKLKIVLDNWESWFDKYVIYHKDKDFLEKWQPEEFIKSLDKYKLGRDNFPEFQHCMESLRNIAQNVEAITDATVDLFDGIEKALFNLFEHTADYKPTFASRTELKLECLNPALAMKDLRRARCVVLSSGTLTPAESLHSELATPFAHAVSLNHVIPRERVWIGSLCWDEKGSGLQFTSAAGMTSAAALGRALVAVCDVTPHGVLAVLPSYRLLRELRSEWQQRTRIGCRSIWDQLKDLKYIVCESSDESENEHMMTNFMQYAASERGALLFAVHRGKFSEGIDFKDQQARCVVCIGIPYPDISSARAKMAYNNKYAKDPRRKLLNGSQWYDIQAYRALNQAVGRCVRHRQDWGAVLLVDVRFADTRPKQNLPKWVRNYMDAESYDLNTLTKDGQSRENLKGFMERMSQEEFTTQQHDMAVED